MICVNTLTNNWHHSGMRIALIALFALRAGWMMVKILPILREWQNVICDWCM